MIYKNSNLIGASFCRCVVFISCLFILSCRTETEIKPTSYYSSPIDPFSISIDTTTGKNKNKKPNISAYKAFVDSIVSISQKVDFGVQRAGIDNKPYVSTIIGTVFTNIPQDLKSLLTRDNKPLFEVGDTINFNKLRTLTVSGWQVSKVNYINDLGGAQDISTILGANIATSLSVIMTFYPDGFYTFINNKDSTLNEFGWYQLCIDNDLPVGIIYNTLASGNEFNDPPSKKSPHQAFGIWGIDKNNFYPLIQIDRNRTVFLGMKPIDY